MSMTSSCSQTNQSPEKGLLRVEGYQWESNFKGRTRQSASRGLGGVVILFRPGLHRIRVADYATRGGDGTEVEDGVTGRMRESPYSGLLEEILQYSSLKEVFLMGDFNEPTERRHSARPSTLRIHRS